MMKKMILAVLLTWSALDLSRAAEPEKSIVISVPPPPSTQAIPFHISGFTPEILSVIKFDLEVLGFVHTNAAQADYIVTGTATSGSVIGKVTYRTNAIQLSQNVNSPNLRIAAHKFADLTIQKLRGTTGVGMNKIVFKADAGRNKVIYYADADAFGAQALTPSNTLVAAPVCVGGMLYYTSYELGPAFIFAQDLRSGNRDVLFKYSGLNASPAVSPDGRRIAVILSKGGTPDLYVANIDGSNLKQLTKTSEASSPCWSPDGSQICYASRASGRPGLFVISAEGGTPRRLGVYGRCTEPDWSPDGKWIAYTVEAGSHQICVSPAGGGEVNVVAEGEDPNWAPNSRTLIFTQGVGTKRLCLLDVPTKRVKYVPNFKGSASQASWVR